MHFEYLKEMRRFLQWRQGNAVLLGEANVLPEESKQYFGEAGDGIHLMFNFFVNQYAFYALATGDTVPFVKALEATKEIPSTSQWAHFLRNHDELDLGRLTEEERQRVFAAFGPEENMQLYERGIRRRLSTMLGSRQKTELAYSLMFSLPGTPVIRYGDEIGMGDNLDLNERDAIRTPMQWSGEKQAGFSKATKLVHPVVSEGYYAYEHINVENQRRDPGSLLNWMTSLIRLRKECPEIGYGSWEILETGCKEILGMCYTWKGKRLLIWHNFLEKSLELVVPRKQAGTDRLVDLLNNIESRVDEKGKHTITLEAYGYRWFRASTD